MRQGWGQSPLYLTAGRRRLAGFHLGIRARARGREVALFTEHCCFHVLPFHGPYNWQRVPMRRRRADAAEDLCRGTRTAARHAGLNAAVLSRSEQTLRVATHARTLCRHKTGRPW